MNNKDFDCVEMMHRGGEEIMKIIEGMTFEEQMAYWKEATVNLKKSNNS